MDPAEVLREQERLLAIEYGASRPPHPLGGEDLECDDARDARHWIGVYTELSEFVHGLIQGECPGSLADPPLEPRQLPPSTRAMALQERVLDLHLAYWTERLRRLGGAGDTSAGEQEVEPRP